MKHKFIIIILLLLMGFVSCDYLDIVPDERPTEEDAFRDKNAAERFLFSCYAYMLNEKQGSNIYQSAEIATTLDDADHLQGTHSAAKVGNFAFWGRMYGGIRRCYTLMNNIDNVPHMDEELKNVYRAEAKFLIAYYHFTLLKAYGPIILVEKELNDQISPKDYQERMKFDDCVTWISNLYDEAYSDLLDEQSTSYYGRATKAAAKSLKGRLYLYAASPLFNGNSEFYSRSLIDPATNEHLMSQTVDPEKWKKALQYCKDAVVEAEKAGCKLYMGIPTKDLPFPEDPIEWRLRMTYADKATNEIIWADTRREDYYGLQNNSTPRNAADDGDSWNNIGPSLTTVKRFYTENGLPIEEDPAYFSKSEYYSVGRYDGEETCNLHLRREPRFYAWISFHNGWYEMTRDNDKRIRTTYRKGDAQGVGNRSRNYTSTGYLMKKSVTPNYDTKNGFKNYAWPLIRLAELYLNVAEAAVESNDLVTAKDYLNRVRVRAGIPKVEDSWNGVATLDQNKMREIVRQERMIEMFMEGQFTWDIKRWKIAEKYMAQNPIGLNIHGVSNIEFFKEREIELAWQFATPKNYLLPIAGKEINVNAKLVQNPGY